MICSTYTSNVVLSSVEHTDVKPRAVSYDDSQKDIDESERERERERERKREKKRKYGKNGTMRREKKEKHYGERSSSPRCLRVYF